MFIFRFPKGKGAGRRRSHATSRDPRPDYTYLPRFSPLCYFFITTVPVVGTAPVLYLCAFRIWNAQFEYYVRCRWQH